MKKETKFFVYINTEINTTPNIILTTTHHPAIKHILPTTGSVIWAYRFLGQSVFRIIKNSLRVTYRYLSNSIYIYLKQKIRAIKRFCLSSKKNSALRLVDVSTDSNKFQELLLERTKALAAQTEALKSSSHSDGKFRFNLLVFYYSLLEWYYWIKECIDGL